MNYIPTNTQVPERHPRVLINPLAKYIVVTTQGSTDIVSNLWLATYEAASSYIEKEKKDYPWNTYHILECRLPSTILPTSRKGEGES